MSTSITFDTIRTEYGFLSPLFPAPFTINNQRWRTLEHFLQGMKTDDLERRDAIRNAPSATLAQLLGNDRMLTPVRQDWNDIVTTDEALQIARAIEVPQITIRDMTILEGLSEKYRSNPSIGNRLLATSNLALVNMNGNTVGSDNNMLGRLTMYVRDRVLATDTNTDDDTGIIFDNLYATLQGQGYNTVVSLNGTPVNIPIAEAPRGDYRGLVIRGRLSEEETTEVVDEETGEARRRRTGRRNERDIEAVVDVYLQGGYSEERLKEVIGAGTTAQPGVRSAQTRRERREDMAYFVVTQLTKQNLNRFLRIATFNNVRFFSPSELFVTPSKHMLSPSIERITPDSTEYELIRGMENKLPELASGDKLAKEKGLVPRDVIKVNDFSPHYRVIT